MPAAARLGDTISTGHGCDATSTIAGALISKVKIDGIIAAVIGDAIAAHTILSGPSCVYHIVPPSAAHHLKLSFKASMQQELVMVLTADQLHQDHQTLL